MEHYTILHKQGVNPYQDSPTYLEVLLHSYSLFIVSINFEQPAIRTIVLSKLQQLLQFYYTIPGAHIPFAHLIVVYVVLIFKTSPWRELPLNIQLCSALYFDGKGVPHSHLNTSVNYEMDLPKPSQNSA